MKLSRQKTAKRTGNAAQTPPPRLRSTSSFLTYSTVASQNTARKKKEAPRRAVADSLVIAHACTHRHLSEVRAGHSTARSSRARLSSSSASSACMLLGTLPFPAVTPHAELLEGERERESCSGVASSLIPHQTPCHRVRARKRSHPATTAACAGGLAATCRAVFLGFPPHGDAAWECLHARKRDPQEDQAPLLRCAERSRASADYLLVRRCAALDWGRGVWVGLVAGR